jgi:thiol-disulfide isomerase/thioredoxin
MKKYNVLLTIAILGVNYIFCQDNLKVGTVAPLIDFQISYPSNYSIPENKAIILEFWATWCGPCVFSLIEQNSIIHKYNHVIEFVSITDNTSSNVEAFIKKKELKQKFIIDNNSSTHLRYHVSSIPQCFLIDKNRIICWKGSPSLLTVDMIDEFVRTGSIKSDSKIKTGNDSTSVFKTTLSDNKLSLEISELPVPDFDYSEFKQFTPDSFQYIANLINLKDIITSLTGDENTRVLFTNDIISLDLKLSVDFSSINCNTEKAKRLIINGIENYCSISIQKKIIDTLVWEMYVRSPQKLQNFETLMTQHKGANNTQGGKFVRITDTEFSFLNMSLHELAKNIENTFNIICDLSTPVNHYYDFYKLNADSFEYLKTQLDQKYGIGLKRTKKKVEFLVIEK